MRSRRVFVLRVGGLGVGSLPKVVVAVTASVRKRSQAFASVGKRWLSGGTLV